MALWVGRQQVKEIFRPFFLCALFILGVTELTHPEEVTASLLNGALTGSIEGDYLYNSMDQNGARSTSRGIDQRYSLAFTENLLDSRLGVFSAGLNWVNDQTSYSGQPEQATLEIVKDYNFSLSLLPMTSPVILFAQKTEQENQFDFVYHNTISTYGFGWVYSPLNLPRFGINATHSSYTSDQIGFFPTSETNFLTLDTGGKWHNYNLSARYLYNQTDDSINGSYWSHGINLSLNGLISKGLTVGAYGNYATRGGTESGLNFYQENALGVNFFYVPNKFTDSNLALDYNEAPGMGDFKRFLTSGGMNFHPTGKFDILNSAQVTKYDTDASQTDSVFANSSLSYRPFFGINIAAGLGGGETTISSGGITSKNTQGTANWSGTYFKTFSSIAAKGGLGYSGSVSKDDSDQLGESSDLSHSFTGSLDNTRTDYVHVGLNGSWTSIDHNVPGQSSDLVETRISGTADTHFFRNLVFNNDSLLVDGTLTYLNVGGYGAVSGETYSEDFHGTYQFLGVFTLIGAFSHLNYPSGYFGGNANIASLNFTGTLQPWQNGVWTFGLNELENDREDQYDQKTSQANTKISHQLGRLNLSAEFVYLRSEAGPTVTVSQQVVARLIRPF
ncbi:MAG: hypothetical protein ACHQYP_00770 [Nitrospiria bacterium]